MAMSVSTSDVQNAKQSAPPFLVRRSGAVLGTRSPVKDAGDAAFALRRRSIVRSGRLAPLERIAAFLVAISRNNTYEGRDPYTIPDSLTCGFVAQLLNIGVQELADLLVALEHQGMVASAPTAGLKLTNLDDLESLADAR
jgi:CRP/FNR family transcriptional regulator, anaerobic regulatory protein